MTTRDVIVNKDSDNDVLYVIRGSFDKVETMNIAVNADMTARIDRGTGKVIGLTIENFSTALPHLKDNPEYILMEKFDTILNFINDSHLVKASAQKKMEVTNVTKRRA